MATNPDSFYTILAFYKFVSLSPAQLQKRKKQIVEFLTQHDARGGILLATEGINGTVCYRSSSSHHHHPNAVAAVAPESVESFLLELFPGLQTRTSYSRVRVFYRLRVRIKDEIVTMGMGHDGIVSPIDHPVGEYIEPSQWDELVVNDPDCMIVDTRNDYEVQLGTFRNAINPKTSSFTEFPKWLDQQLQEKRPSKIAMFCTGGVRCEKATSYCQYLVKDKGIPVYHLKGGILAYLDHAVDPSQGTFDGECYVFDQRVAVTYGLKPSNVFEACYACRHPLTPDDRQHPEYRCGVACPHCSHDHDREARRARYEHRVQQIQTAEQKGLVHLGSGKTPPTSG